MSRNKKYDVLLSELIGDFLALFVVCFIVANHDDYQVQKLSEMIPLVTARLYKRHGGCLIILLTSLVYMKKSPFDFTLLYLCKYL